MSKKRNGRKTTKRFEKLRKILKDPPVIINTHVITLDAQPRTDLLPRIVCTCGEASERSDNLMDLGFFAKKHEEENPGHYRRSHV